MARWRRPRGTRRVRGRSRRWRRCAACRARAGGCGGGAGGAGRARRSAARGRAGRPGGWRRSLRSAGARVVPGGFDQEPAGVGRGLGDRALGLRLSGLIEARRQSEPGEQLAWRGEALPVAAELEMQHQRRQRVDAAKAPQPCDRRPQPVVGREPRQSLVERVLARDQPVDGGERSMNASSVGACSKRWPPNQPRCGLFHVVVPS